MTSENNEVRCIGIRPAHNTDDFPVSQADKDLLKMTIHLMAYHLATTTWKKVQCDVNGKLIVDPTAILENPPVEDNAGKAATSEWCYDHWKNAAAHHAKYTDAAARAVYSPLSLPVTNFFPLSDTYDWNMNPHFLKNRISLTGQYFVCSVIIPDGCTITKVTLYGYRDDGASSMLIGMQRNDREGNRDAVVTITANWVDGYNSLAETIISNAVIDNDTYGYTVYLYLDPNDSVDDVQLTGIKIEFTG